MPAYVHNTSVLGASTYWKYGYSASELNTCMKCTCRCMCIFMCMEPGWNVCRAVYASHPPPESVTFETESFLRGYVSCLYESPGALSWWSVGAAIGASQPDGSAICIWCQKWADCRAHSFQFGSYIFSLPEEVLQQGDRRYYWWESQLWQRLWVESTLHLSSVWAKGLHGENQDPAQWWPKESNGVVSRQVRTVTELTY